MNIPLIRTQLKGSPLDNLVGVQPMSKETLDKRTAIKNELDLPLEQYTNMANKYSIQMDRDTIEELEKKLKKIQDYKKNKNNRKLQKILEFFEDRENMSEVDRLSSDIAKLVDINILKELEDDVRRMIEKRKSEQQ